jgi:hypothetical protein
VNLLVDSGRVVVDPRQPFIGTTDGRKGAAEESAVIGAGDVLLAINGQQVTVN